MKITNKLNLPKSFLIKDDERHEPIENRYSVTEILGSTKEIILKRKYYNELTVDLCDMIPALFGTAVHSVLEENVPDGMQAEIKMEMEIAGKTLVGKCDLLDIENKLIGDYKTCSVSKITKADFNDWKLQGLMYAYMQYYKYNHEIRHLRFYALMKDWSKLKSYITSNYPSSPVYVWEYDIEDSDYIFIEKYIKDKFTDIDNGIKNCSPEEKWFTGNKYGVYKNIGDKRAMKVFDNKEDAEKYADENKCSYIDERPGENLKCLYYCDVCKWCSEGGKGGKN